MPRNFKLPALNLKGIQVKDPRVAMRAVLGVLLLANLVAARDRVQAVRRLGRGPDAAGSSRCAAACSDCRCGRRTRRRWWTR